MVNICFINNTNSFCLLVRIIIGVNAHPIISCCVYVTIVVHSLVGGVYFSPSRPMYSCITNTDFHLRFCIYFYVEIYLFLTPSSY